MRQAWTMVVIVALAAALPTKAAVADLLPPPTATTASADIPPPRSTGAPVLPTTSAASADVVSGPETALVLGAVICVPILAVFGLAVGIVLYLSRRRKRRTG